MDKDDDNSLQSYRLTQIGCNAFIAQLLCLPTKQKNQIVWRKLLDSLQNKQQAQTVDIALRFADGITLNYELVILSRLFP